jgi:hypothetical protein
MYTKVFWVNHELRTEVLSSSETKNFGDGGCQKRKHADFDGQNVLFTDPKHTNSAQPQLTGIVDWENVHTAPLYLLYKYPILIRDNGDEKAAYTTNTILRPHFCRELCAQFPRGSDAYIEARCIMDKFSTLDIFMLCGME